jgi:hypothetical protein
LIVIVNRASASGIALMKVFAAPGRAYSTPMSPLQVDGRIHIIWGRSSLWRAVKW